MVVYVECVYVCVFMFMFIIQICNNKMIATPTTAKEQQQHIDSHSYTELYRHICIRFYNVDCLDKRRVHTHTQR